MKRVAALLLVLALALSPVSAAAAGTESPFTDVAQEQYYYDAVLEMYGAGVINGYGDGRFGPADPVTRAQALTMLCRLAGVDTTPFDDGAAWYSGTEGWALAAGALQAGTDLNGNATREEIAQYITAVYRLTLSDNRDGFADTDSVYANTLKDYGVSIGYLDAAGRTVFGGDAQVKRCDLCLMLSRLRVNAARPDWSGLVPTETAGFVPVVFDAELVTRPETTDDLLRTLRYMMQNGVTSHSFVWEADPGYYYADEDVEQITDWVYTGLEDALDVIADSDPASATFYLGYNLSGTINSLLGHAVSITYTITLRVKEGMDDAGLAASIAAYRRACTETLAELTAAGTVRPDMSARELALALFQYVDRRFVYDSAYSGAVVSACVAENRAVCQGYVAFYTSLCHLVGVPVYAQSSDTHVWNYVTLTDGTRRYIDVTWGDPVPDRPGYSNTAYFWLTEAELLALDPGRPL